MNVFWAFLGMILLLGSSPGCAPSGQEEIHVLPDGYVGPVLIVFGQEGGQPPELQNGKRIYKIPDTGVRRTQFRAQYGVVPARYYYVRHDTLSQELGDLTGPEEDSAGDGVYVFRAEAGSVSNIERQGNVSRSRGVRFHYRRYVVGRVAEGDSLARRATRLLQREAR